MTSRRLTRRISVDGMTRRESSRPDLQAQTASDGVDGVAGGVWVRARRNAVMAWWSCAEQGRLRSRATPRGGHVWASRRWDGSRRVSIGVFRVRVTVCMSLGCRGVCWVPF
jgi:hypothetical protein